MTQAPRVFEKWELSYAQDSRQKHAIALLEETSCTRPFPANIPDDQVSSPRLLRTSSMIGSESLQDGADLAVQAPRRIENGQQFFQWFSSIETEMERDREQVYQFVLRGIYCQTVTLGLTVRSEYVEKIKSFENFCSSLLDGLSEAERLVAELQTCNNSVSQKTANLKSASEKIVADQVGFWQMLFKQATEALSRTA